MNQSQENFKLYLELFVRTAKDAKARLEIIKKEQYNSTEQRIQLEVLNKHIGPQLINFYRLVNSAIFTHTKYPKMLPKLTKYDIIKAQLTLDEVNKILESSGAIIINNYNQDEVSDK